MSAVSWLASYIRAEVTNAHPLVLSSLFGLLRRIRPVLRVGQTLIVLRHDDIRDVLGRPQDFELGAVAEHKMLMGPFLLGLDPWRYYETMHHELRTVLQSHTVRARHLARDESEAEKLRLRDRLTRRQRLDLVDEFAIPVLSRTAQALTGVTAPQVAHLNVPPDRMFEAVTRMIGSIVAVEQPAPFGLEETGNQTAAAFRRHLDVLADSRWRSGDWATARPNILDNLIANAVAAGQTPNPANVAQIRAKVAGLTLAAITPILKAFAHTVEQLLRRRDWYIDGIPALRYAVALAGEGRKKELSSLIREALRFHPVFPLLQRYAPRDTVIARGLDRECRVPAGTNVVVALISGMFDDTTVRRSGSFNTPRPEDDYLHFGSGQHFCLGAGIAIDHLTERLARYCAYPDFTRLSSSAQSTTDPPSTISG